MEFLGIFGLLFAVTTVSIGVAVGLFQKAETAQLLSDQGGSVTGTRYNEYTTTQLSSMSFMICVNRFFTTLNPSDADSVPRQLRDNHWWEILSKSPKERSFTVKLKFFEPLAATASVVEMTVLATIRMIPGKGTPKSDVMMIWHVSGIHPGSIAAGPLVQYTWKELQLQLVAAETSAPGPDYESQPDLRNPADWWKPETIVRSWPTPQDYNEAMQNPQMNFHSKLLKNGRPDHNSIGLPRAATGAFASVYKVTTEGAEHAIKCFLTLPQDQEQRFAMISSYILSDDLEYTVDFEYQTKGILVKGQWVPILRMQWVEGTPLHFYVRNNLHNRDRLQKVADEFYTMCERLRTGGIAHGDLQHGNVIITKDGIRLVDYDGMYVPQMDGMFANELGHRNYQHPGREGKHFGPWLDNFSAWVIYLTLRMLIVDAGLWTGENAGDECLLFKRTDFLKPNESKLFAVLNNHKSEQVRSLNGFLIQLLECSPETVPYLNARFN